MPRPKAIVPSKYIGFLVPIPLIEKLDSFRIPRMITRTDVLVELLDRYLPDMEAKTEPLNFLRKDTEPRP
jgi:hypothetical protein